MGEWLATPARVALDEPCPHCGVQLIMELPGEQAKRGFDCPYCSRGVARITGLLMWVPTLGGLGIGTLFIVLLTVIFGTLLMFVLEQWSEHALPVLVVVSGALTGLLWLCVRSTAHNLKLMMGLTRGKRLVQAVKQGTGYRLNVTPMAHRLRLKRGEQDVLPGAITMHDEADEARGRISPAADDADAKRGGLSIEE